MKNENFIDYFWQRSTELVLHNEEDLSSYTGSLYHYTTPVGLLGILQSQSFWGTEAAFLNDSLEIRYGINLIISELEKLSDRQSCTFIDELIGRAIECSNQLYDETYISCFSENGDLLSQWKGYASFGNGYSIELDTEQLSKFKRKHPYFKISLKKVIYEMPQQIEIIRQESLHVIEKTKYFIDTYPDKIEQTLTSASSALAYYLRNIAIYFKDSAFAEEREWRAVYLNSDHSEEGRQAVKFRISSNDIIPYMELDISPSAQKKKWLLPIKKIIAGSKVNTAKVEKCIKLIYKIHGIEPPCLENSKIPLQ